jgi:LytS/YehU family sensor histidine kinase
LKREKSENNSVGLKNIEERLGLVYGNQHTLSIATDENLFKVDLRIQWRK